MSARGLNPTSLAKLSGVPQPTIRRIAIGETEFPEQPTVERLADALGVTPAQLRGEDPFVETGALVPKYIYVARYDAIAGLGPGRLNEPHVEVSGTHAYRREFVEKHGWKPEQLAVIEAEGPSMAPTINDGDVVLVNLAETRVKSGEVYAIEDPDQGTRIKRLHRTLDGRIRVASDNDDKRLYPDDYLTPDTGARIIGRVVHRSGAV